MITMQIGQNDIEDFINDREDHFHFLLSESELKQQNKLLEEFALNEYLAHTIAYQGTSRSKNQLKEIKKVGFPIFDEEGMVRYYDLIKLNSQHKGIVGEIFTPRGKHNGSKIYINFAGTHNSATLLADLEPCPGEKSFQKNKRVLMTQIIQIIDKIAKKTGQSVELNFTGHSLGGAYAQQAFTESMRYAAKNISNRLLKDGDQKTFMLIETFDKQLCDYIQKRYKLASLPISKENSVHFDKVKTMKVGTWNSAGVGSEIERFSNHISAILIDNGKEIIGRFGMVSGDGIQQSGEGTVLSDCKTSKDDKKADVVTFKRKWVADKVTPKKSILTGIIGAIFGKLIFGKPGALLGTILGSLTPYIISTLTAHTCIHFNQCHDLDPSQYELNRNNSIYGHQHIKNILQQKSKILQTATVQKGMHFLRKIAKINDCFSKSFQKQPVISKFPSFYR